VANPLRSEGAAFRFLLGALVYFAAIAIAGVINAWAGLAVFILLTAGLVVWWWRKRPTGPRPVQAVSVPSGPADERRILVIANETVEGAPLLERIRELSSADNARVLVVTPALNSPLRHLASDEDDARAAARERLDRSLATLRENGVEASGQVGDGDPLQAIEDALRTFGADEVVISTHP
jgi:hypothetical protein